MSSNKKPRALLLPPCDRESYWIDRLIQILKKNDIRVYEHSNHAPILCTHFYPPESMNEFIVLIPTCKKKYNISLVFPFTTDEEVLELKDYFQDWEVKTKKLFEKEGVKIQCVSLDSMLEALSS